MLRDFARLINRWQRASGAGHERHARLLHGFAGIRLGAHQLHCRSGGTDEFDFGAFARTGELGIFRKESVAWMNGFGAAFARNLQNALDVQICVAGGR